MGRNLCFCLGVSTVVWKANRPYLLRLLREVLPKAALVGLREVLLEAAARGSVFGYSQLVCTRGHGEVDETKWHHRAAWHAYMSCQTRCSVRRTYTRVCLYIKRSRWMEELSCGGIRRVGSGCIEEATLVFEQQL